MRSHVVVPALAAGALFVAACGASEVAAPTDSVGDETTPTSAVPPDTEASDVVRGPDGFERVESIQELVGIWIPVKVGGDDVDAAALGAYAQFTLSGDSLRMNGYDGCNNNGGYPIDGEQALIDGRLVGLDFSTNMMDCDIDTRVSPGQDAMLFIGDGGESLIAQGIAFVGDIRYARVESIPVDPRQAVWEAEAEAEEAQRQAERDAEQAAADQNRADGLENARTELPEARARWAAAGIGTYTLRFENASLKNDPSFPQARPVGGVWEIEVVDGVALDNEWSQTILGDTVEDWFAYVESQLDSYYLQVSFDPDRGFPTRIDSQPLDDRVVDSNEIVAWVIVAEIETSG